MPNNGISVYNQTTEGRMRIARDTIQAVSQKFANNPTYTMWIDFKLNALHVNSITPDVNQNIIVSFQNKKTGIGSANMFTLTIAHAPMARGFDFSTGQMFNPNSVDEAILAANFKGASLSNRYCELSYGYADEADEASFRTETYHGMVIDYTCDIQDSILLYTLTGYSGLTAITESKEPLVITVEDSGIINAYGASSTAINAADFGDVQPTKAVRQIVEKYLQSGVDEPMENPAWGERQPLSQYISYELIFDYYDGKSIEGTDAYESINTQLDKNPAQAISDILNMAITQEDKDLLEQNIVINPENKVKYGWYLSETSSDPRKYISGSIHVYRNDPKRLADIKDTDVDLVFNWMTPGKTSEINNIVRSFRPNYDGKNLLALADAKFNPNGQNENNNHKLSRYEEAQSSMHDGTFYLDNSGFIGRVPVNSISSPTGGTSKSVIDGLEQERSSWIFDLQYPYKAQMVTIGIPCEIPITGLIRVVPLIYGQPHFSAGIYEILSISDQLTTGGFETTWELIRVNPPKHPDEQSSETVRIEPTVPSSPVVGSDGWEVVYPQSTDDWEIVYPQ